MDPIFFVKSIDTMKQRDAVFFAIFAAAAMLSKYYAVVLLAACAILLFHPHARRYFLSTLPRISGVVFLALVSPHIYWVLENNAQTVTYAMNRAGHGVIAATWSAVRFLLEYRYFISE